MLALRSDLPRRILTLLTPVFFVHASAAVAAEIVDLDAAENAVNDPVQITLGAGQYLVTPIIGTYTAWNAWSGVSGCEPDGTGCDGGWLNAYRYSSASIPETPVTSGDIYSTPELAFANAVTETFTLSQQETVSFFITDSPDELYNNWGGLSLSVSLIPEPATSAMLLFGLSLLGIGRAVTARGAANKSAEG